MKTKIQNGSVHGVANGAAVINVDGAICATSYRVEKTPHWLKYGDGTAVLECQGAMLGKGAVDVKDKCWLQLDTSECGEKSSKRTMICLHGAADIARLRDLCNLILGE